jgi:acetoacetyl-CoA synthetase
VSDLLHAADAARAARSQLTAFARFLEASAGRSFPDYRALHAFSLAERAAFWAALLDWSGVRCEGEKAPVVFGDAVETARFFPGLRLSWAENLLRPGDAEAEAAAALVSCDESGGRVELSRGELRRRVRAVAGALRARGIGAGDRVVAVARNNADTVVACLAATSLGAAWSSVAPDMGLQAALSRFTQLGPRALLAHQVTQVNGARIVPQLEQLVSGLPTLQLVVGLDGEPESAVTGSVPRTSLEALAVEGAGLPGFDPAGPWDRFPFDQPLFILFSSGTTGAPKCIIHGHGGTLIEHLKELRLHCDLGPADRLLFQTSTGWMMWNWMVSVLEAGSCLVTYDGSVSYPEPDALLRVLAREQVTAFGTSPAFLKYLADAGVAPAPGSLALREMYSTGSVLYPHLHRFAKEHLADVPLQSISGGTDIVGCFVQGQPWGAVHAGESACLGLGLDVRVWTPDGVLREGRGELVCCAPFPSRPVGLFGDPDGSRFHRAYFSQHEGVWTHGDLLEVTSLGSARILGRCDGILNIRGIRIGPGEIYGVLADAVPEVAEAMAADQEALEEPGGRRLVLLVVMKSGHKLDRALAMKVKRELRQRASAAHVPAVLLQVDELPTTFSGKRSEAALQDALSGRPVRNLAALRNPACLDAILANAALQLPRGAES